MGDVCITRFTTIDYPGELAAVLYFPGCPLRCPYCHNRDLADGHAQGGVDMAEVQRFLLERSGKLTGVVLSGGDPALQGAGMVVRMSRMVHKMGYKLKMDTAAVVPLDGMLPELDMIAVDIKTVPERYPEFSRIPDEGIVDTLRGNISKIEGSGIRREYRTTVHKALLSPGDLRRIRDALVPQGAPWVLQQYHRSECYMPALNDAQTYTDKELGDLARELGATMRGGGS